MLLFVVVVVVVVILLITHFAALSAAHTFRVSFNVFACNAAGCHKRTRNHYYFFCLFCFVCLLCLIKRNVPKAAPTVARRCMRNKFKKKQNNLIINIKEQPKNSFFFEHSLCCLLWFYVLLWLLLLLSCCISMFCGGLCAKRFRHLHTMFSIKGGMKCITYTQWLTMQISPGQT